MKYLNLRFFDHFTGNCEEKNATSNMTLYSVTVGWRFPNLVKKVGALKFELEHCESQERV